MASGFISILWWRVNGAAGNAYVRSHLRLDFPNYTAALNHPEYAKALSYNEYVASLNYREYVKRLDFEEYTKTINLPGI